MVKDVGVWFRAEHPQLVGEQQLELLQHRLRPPASPSHPERCRKRAQEWAGKRTHAKAESSATSRASPTQPHLVEPPNLNLDVAVPGFVGSRKEAFRDAYLVDRGRQNTQSPLASS